MKEKLKKIIKSVVKEDIDIQILIPADKKQGDYSSNIAFLLAKKRSQKPNDIALEISQKINNIKSEILQDVKVQNGFINLYLKPEFLQNEIHKILQEKENYGSNNIGKKQKLQIEFVSANPTGPLTIGNARGGIIGDVLANIFKKSGYNTTREYYFNDAGEQIKALGHSVLKDDEAVYKGEYIDKLHQQIKALNVEKVGQEAAKIIIDSIQKTALKMGIEFDIWFKEGADLREKGKVEEIVEWLRKNNLAYEKDEAIWFKSTQFGDDKDRVLIKKTGEPTYFGVDCAYHKNKFLERNFDKVINIWGADHHGDVSRLKGFVEALGFKEKFEIILHQFVRLIENGKEVRMSKRKGKFILVDDLLNTVSKDVLRYFMLQYSSSSHVDFDLKLAKEKSQKNPVFYIQYAYARICGIIDKLKDKNADLGEKEADLSLLNNPEELDLIKEMIKFPDIIREINFDYQTQKLAFYSYNLATTFHYFYEKCRVLSDDKRISIARLKLLLAIKIVLKNCLDLMEISGREKM